MPPFDDVTGPGGYWTYDYLLEYGSQLEGFVYADNTPIVGNPTVGVVRYSEYDTAANYKMIAGDFAEGESLLNADVGDPRAKVARAVSGFGFDVVPPGETYALHVGWANGSINDFGVVAQEVGSVAYLSGYGPASTFFNNLAQYQINAPRFGVTTF